MIDKLNSINAQAFTGKQKPVSKPEKTTPEHQKQVIVVSKDGAKALRNSILGGLGVLLAGSAVTPLVTGCEDEILKVSLSDSLYQNVVVNYNPEKVDPDTIYVYKDSIVNDTVWQTDTIYQDNMVNDTVCQTDTIYKDSIIYLPGDTIRDTIKIELPADTVYIEPDYESPAADSLIAHCENLGFTFDGEGTIPIRMNVFDQWNTTNHDLVFDGEASSKEKMVFIDEAKDYSKDSSSPEVRYNRIEFSPDYGNGLTSHVYNAPTVGVKPTSAAAWMEAAKTCNTNYKNGLIGISEYNSYGSLSPIGYLEKSSDADVDFYENLFVESDETDTYNWSEARITLANPTK